MAPELDRGGPGLLEILRRAASHEPCKIGRIQDDADTRRRELVDLTVAELVERVLFLEDEREMLARLIAEAARMPMCGAVMGDVSCQLMRGHDGLHAWGRPDEATVVRWG